MSRIAVALSGGGHRATLFGLGVLIYLADSGKNREVSSVASVSGGSIANGFLAQEVDFAQCDADELRASVAAPLAERVSQSGTLFAPLTTKLYLGALALSAVLVLLCGWHLCGGNVAPRFLLATVVLWTAWLAGQRGKVCAVAYRTTMFSPTGRATRLVDLKRRVLHVICATDVRTARQVYFSPKFVYGYSLGWAPPGDIPLHEAVHASAAFPGGFPAFRLSTRGLELRDEQTGEARKDPVAEFVLADGGLYDNMADQWARGFRGRVERWPWLATQQEEPDTLIVVNSSSRHSWSPFEARLPGWGEVAALLRDMNVLYENTTAVRRQDLVERFDQAEKQGVGLRGALVMIDQSPYAVASFFASAEQREIWPERARRADEARAMLDAEGADSWREVTRQNAAVPTVLRTLGVEVGARLLRHAYVLAMCNLHVLLGYPLLALPPPSRFDDLVHGGAAC